MRLNCKYIFHNQKFARRPHSDRAWVKSQQSAVLVSFVFFSIPLRSAQLPMSIWRGEPSMLHLIKNTADGGMEIYPIWELKNASARPLCGANSHIHTFHFAHREAQHCIAGHCMCHCVMTFWTLWRVWRTTGWLCSDGGQETVPNLNISRYLKDLHCVQSTLDPCWLSVTPLTIGITSSLRKTIKTKHYLSVRSVITINVRTHFLQQTDNSVRKISGSWCIFITFTP